MSDKLTQVVLKTPYSVDVDTLWASLIQYPLLTNPGASKAYYVGIPDREVQTGDVFDIKMRLFKVMPPTDWHVEVVTRDDAEHKIRLEERGGAIKRWRHAIRAEQNGPMKSVVIDDIVMDAGALTPLAARWARRMYGARRRFGLQMPRIT